MASTAVFEGLKAHATNIILKSGPSDDNPNGMLAVHILPRWQDDGLQELLWKPNLPDYDLDTVASDIKDKTWNVKYESSVKEEKEETFVKPEVVKIGGKKKSSVDEEIKLAIEKMKIRIFTVIHFALYSNH